MIDKDTTKTFTELTQNDIEEMTVDQAMPYAIAQGWKDPETFNGDKSKLKDAKKYLQDTFNEMPILRQNLLKKSDETDILRKEIKKQSEQFTKIIERQTQRHKKELEAKIRESERKADKAEEAFDQAGLKEATKEVLEFKNELNDLEKEEKERKKHFQMAG